MLESDSRELKELTVLASARSQDTNSDGMVEDWATDSLVAAREAYQDPTTGKRISPGAKFGQAYLDKSVPVVRQRLYQAGAVLNEALAAN